MNHFQASVCSPSKMWWEDPDFASKSTGMSGFVNFTDNLPLGCPYGKFCQQRLRVWIFPDFYYSPRIFAAWQCMHAPGYSGICAYIRIFSSIGGGGTDINLDQIFSSIGGY